MSWPWVETIIMKGFFFYVFFLISLAAFKVQARKYAVLSPEQTQILHQKLQLVEPGQPKPEIPPEVMVARKKYLSYIKKHVVLMSDFKTAIEQTKTQDEFEQVLKDNLSKDGSKYNPILEAYCAEHIAEMREVISGDLLKKMVIFTTGCKINYLENEYEAMKKGEIHKFDLEAMQTKIHKYYFAQLPFHKTGWFKGIMIGGSIGLVVGVLAYFVRRRKAAAKAAENGELKV